MVRVEEICRSLGRASQQKLPSICWHLTAWTGKCRPSYWGDLDWAVAVKGQMFKPLLYTVVVLVPCHQPDNYLRAAND